MTDEEKIAEVEAVLDDCWVDFNDDPFGACVLCGSQGGSQFSTTIGKSDWLYCSKHKIAWNFGWGNFSSWKHLGRFGQIAIAHDLDGFRVIEEGKPAGYLFEADVAIKAINKFWNYGDDDDDAIDLRADHGA